MVVHYSRPRVYLDRAAWEQLPPDGVLVMRVRPAEAPSYTLAITRTELEAVFGSVRGTAAWDEARCYHFSKAPPATVAFRVDIDPELPGPAAVAHSPVPVLVQRGEVGRQATTGEPTSAIAWAHAWSDRLGLAREPAQYLEQVESWRAAWRPSRVRVLLVAESHVGPRASDGHVVVRVPACRTALPAGFCRLVYCLGYGEGSLCAPAPEENTGTWQFWDIFAAVGYGPDVTSPRKSGTKHSQRVQWKLDTLRRLQDRGVWLVDASVMALYAPGGRRAVDGSDYDRLVRESFQHWVWPSVEEDDPEQVWVIGRGVGRALAGLPRVDQARVVSQPQDRDRDRVQAGIRALAQVGR